LSDDVAVKFGADVGGLVAGVDEVKDQVKGLQAPFDALRDSLGRVLEATGRAFAADSIKEFATGMAELGEGALNTGFALGLSVRQVGELQGEFVLAGADADEAQRAIVRLGSSVQQALQDPTGAAAAAFKNLGISLAEVRAKGNDLPSLLQLIVDRAAESGQPLQRIAALHELIGRAVDSLIPSLRKGAAGWDELRQRSQGYAEALERNAGGMAQTAEGVNRLTLDLKTLGTDAFGALKPLIDFCTYALDGFAKELDQTVRDTETDIQNILKLGEALNKFANWASFGAIPMAGWDRGPDTTAAAGSEGPTIGNGKPGGGHPRSGANPDENADEDKDLDREIEEETRQRIAALDAEKRAADIDFQSQIAHLQALVREGKLTAAAALQQEQLLNTQKWSADENYLQQKLDLYAGDAAGMQRVQDDELTQTAEFNAKMVALADKAAEATQQSWKQSVEQLSGAFAGFAADVILRTKSIALAFDQMVRSLLDDFLKSTTKGLFDELLFGSSGSGSSGSGGAGGGGSGGLFGSLGGDLVKSLFGDAFKGLVGNPFSTSGGGLLGGLLPLGSGAAGGGVLAGLFDGLFGGGAGFGNTATDFSSAAGGATFGGLFSAILSPFKWLGGLLGFAGGGLVPSAAGGWVVPHFADGGILSMLHQNEMVLPAPISQGLQSMIAANGAGGGVPGGGHTINISAIDAGGVQRLFMNNGSALVAALNKAMRNGAPLYQPS
jgi:hypothetical protein